MFERRRIIGLRLPEIAANVVLDLEKTRLNGGGTAQSPQQAR
jgi:hypothetical protein